MISAVNCCIVVSLCATATFAVDSAIDRNDTMPQPTETEVTITIVSYPEGYDPDNPDPTDSSESAGESS